MLQLQSSLESVYVRAALDMEAIPFCITCAMETSDIAGAIIGNREYHCRKDTAWLKPMQFYFTANHFALDQVFHSSVELHLYLCIDSNGD